MAEPWSLTKLSNTLGIDRRTLIKKLGDTAFALDPKSGAKNYDVNVAMRAIYGAEKPPADFDQAKARKMAAEAALSEIELMKARDEVVSLPLMMEQIGVEYANLRNRLLAIPTKVAPLLDGTDGAEPMRRIVEAAIIEALEELSSGG